ncbi:PTS sugar transporter subunit IIA [Sporomusa termitida]|uniref:Mannitol-specific phosphotransferase enzyme IIA component n=1 Tax=Sporomusa termitida TaxID=2377 RepID=A0A517DYV2_9FIRM|nr:PTS sugar transporter subunit IIA [Sporomusa termitida]QDR82557.1 Mannitol-specific phosphotransferase enzyme IIA component [Sporomusa termitida]
MRFDRNLVFIKSDLRSRDEIVEFLGRQLVAAGAVQPDYITAMHKREQDTGTYITEGVAIPHGTEESRSLVNKTAIAIVKIPGGIEWIDGKKVYLAFGIAGNNDEHVALLGGLAGLLMDAGQKEQLMAAGSEEELFTYLEENIT